MVEVARAFTVTDDAARPRHPRRADLLARRRTPPASCSPSCAASSASGASCILISHLLGEVLQHADRIVVMRDGKVVAADAAARLRPRPAGGGDGRRGARQRLAGRSRRRAQQRRRRCGCARGPRGRRDGRGARRACRARSSALPGSPAMARPICCSRSSTRARSRAQRRHRGHRAGGAGRRRPPVGRHLPAMVDRREHRHPLACAAAPTAC